MSIRKRTWTAKGETKSAWVIDYTDQNGKRRLKTFDLKKDAEAWGVTARHEVATGVHAPDSKATVADVWSSGSTTTLTTDSSDRRSSSGGDI